MSSPPDPSSVVSLWAKQWLADFDVLRPWRTFVTLGDLTPKSAYALQGEVARLRENRGEHVIGYKIGCTSRVIQDQLGIREPIFARIFDTGCYTSECCRLDHLRFANLAVEGELAIRLSRGLPGGPLSDTAYVDAIESVFPVIELHHFQLPANQHPLAPLIASGGMHAGFVCNGGEVRCSDGVPVVESLEVSIDDVRVGLTADPWAMGGPAEALRWLSGRLAEWGLQLLPGQVILTGSALPLFPVGPASRVVAQARPLGMCSVAID